VFSLDLLGVPGSSIALGTPLSVGTDAWSPSGLFSGYGSDGTNVTIPISALNDLTADNAEPSTGDAREVARALCSSLMEYHNALTSKPSAFEAKVLSWSIQVAGNFAGKVKVTYQFGFYQDLATRNIADEPSA